MRIRKHAKISPLLYASSSLKTHVCQLNQSPWDVMTFSPPSSPPPPPPPPLQANGSGGRVGNGTSKCFVSVSERELSSRRRSEYREAATRNKANEEDTAAAAKNDVNIICCKTDGKSWQCRREAAEGNSLCSHHLSMVKSYSSVGHHAGSKSGKAAEEAQRRTRAKKPLTSSSSNPHEFYYYSGFGPSWGKRRGESRNNSEAGFQSQISIEDFDFGEYEEDEEDEEEEESRDNNGKKRVRKPIKARSLKSLL